MPKPSFNWDRLAGAVWPILVARASERKTIYYGEIAPYIKVHHRHVRLSLGPIQSYCMEQKLPPLTSLVVSKSNHEPGLGFIAWDRGHSEEAQAQVYDFDWSKEHNPFENLGRNDTEESLSKDVIRNPGVADEVFAKVPVRGMAQRIFRSVLMNIYEYRCAMCGLSFTDALEGAHIVPYNRCTNSQKISPENGVLLCSSHHKLFDVGSMTINSNFNIIYEDPEGMNEPYSDVDRKISLDLVGKKIFLPKDHDLRPSVDLLRHRNSVLGWTSEMLRE